MENSEKNSEIIEKPEKKLIVFKKSTYIAVLIISVLVIFVILWMTDTPPIENDYTISDLRSAPPEVAESYNLMLLFTEDPCSEGAPAIGLDAEDVDNLNRISEEIRDANVFNIDAILEANREDIEVIWDKSLKGSQIIAKLDSYEEIADLSPLKFDTDLSYLSNFRRMIIIYSCYSLLQLINGGEIKAMNVLIQSDSVCRKVSLNSRMVINKLVCYFGIALNLGTANEIANHPGVSRESLEILSNHFRPLTPEEMSLRNGFIFEYLIFSGYISDGKLSDFPRIFSDNRNLPSRFRIFLFNKPNSGRKLYRNMCDRWIAREEGVEYDPNESFSVWPMALSFLPQASVRMDSDEPWPIAYCMYNPTGYSLAGILVSSIEQVHGIKVRTMIQDDLLQIVINKRLGRPVDLKARAYSDEYIIDVDKKLIFSPGPDEIAYTDDDIKFQINPGVLNLGSSVQE